MKHRNHINARLHITYIYDYHVFNLSNEIYTIIISLISQHRYNKGGKEVCIYVVGRNRVEQVWQVKI